MGILKRILLALIIVVMGLITLQTALALEIETEKTWTAGKEYSVIAKFGNKTYIDTIIWVQDAEGNIIHSSPNLKSNNSFVITQIKLPKNIEEGTYLIVAEGKLKEGAIEQEVQAVQIQQKKYNWFTGFFVKLRDFWFG